MGANLCVVNSFCEKFRFAILLTNYLIGECKEYYEDPWIFGEEEETEDSADGEGEADESGSGEGSGAVGKKPIAQPI